MKNLADRRRYARGCATQTLEWILAEERRLGAFGFHTAPLHWSWCAIIRAELRRRATTGAPSPGVSS